MKNKFRNILKRWLVKSDVSIVNERIEFVKRSIPNNTNCAVVKVFFIATGVKKQELLNYLPNLNYNDMDKINDDATLSCYATTDANGIKYFFYENWFYNYDFERSKLYKVDNWPNFTRHWIDISVRWDNPTLK